MSKYPPLYIYSLDNARHCGEVDKWRESHKVNIECAGAIEEAIKRDYQNNTLSKDCAKSVIEAYGFSRVNFILQNSLQQCMWDGRFSQSNKDWAKSMHIPKSNIRDDYRINAHPVILNGFVDEARAEWDKLGLFDISHCKDSDEVDNYVGKVLVLSPNALSDEYKTPEDQLFYATGGFGCYPDKIGTKVFGYFLKDDENCSWLRGEFIGVIKDEYLPEWAAEKLIQKEAEAMNEESESEGMGGIS